MDPSANLAEQLRLAERLEDPNKDPWYREHGMPGDAARLAELVLALDQWIRRGGGVPDRWHVAVHAAQDVTGMGKVR